MMSPTASARINAVWLILSAVTVVSWVLVTVHGVHDTSPSRIVTIAALVIAAVKVRLIMSEFMEVRTAPVWLGRLADGWLVTMTVALVAMYLS